MSLVDSLAFAPACDGQEKPIGSEDTFPGDVIWMRQASGMCEPYLVLSTKPYEALLLFRAVDLYGVQTTALQAYWWHFSVGVHHHPKPEEGVAR